MAFGSVMFGDIPSAANSSRIRQPHGDENMLRR
jgi:hypothetical protein